MSRYSVITGIVRRATAQQRPQGTGGGFGLSGYGRLVAAILVLPGAAAVLTALALPSSATKGGLSTATLTLAGGFLTILTAYPFTLIHAIWSRSLRGNPDDPVWPDRQRQQAAGRAPAVLVGLVLAATNLVAAVLFGALAGRYGVELVTTVLFAATTLLHLLLTATRRR